MGAVRNAARKGAGAGRGRPRPARPGGVAAPEGGHRGGPARPEPLADRPDARRARQGKDRRNVHPGRPGGGQRRGRKVHLRRPEPRPSRRGRSLPVRRICRPGIRRVRNGRVLRRRRPVRRLCRGCLRHTGRHARKAGRADQDPPRAARYGPPVPVRRRRRRRRRRHARPQDGAAADAPGRAVFRLAPDRAVGGDLRRVDRRVFTVALRKGGERGRGRAALRRSHVGVEPRDPAARPVRVAGPGGRRRRARVRRAQGRSAVGPHRGGGRRPQDIRVRRRGDGPRRQGAVPLARQGRRRGGACVQALGGGTGAGVRSRKGVRRVDMPQAGSEDRPGAASRRGRPAPLSGRSRGTDKVANGRIRVARRRPRGDPAPCARNRRLRRGRSGRGQEGDRGRRKGRRLPRNGRRRRAAAWGRHACEDRRRPLVPPPRRACRPAGSHARRRVLGPGRPGGQGGARDRGAGGAHCRIGR